MEAAFFLIAGALVCVILWAAFMRFWTNDDDH